MINVIIKKCKFSFSYFSLIFALIVILIKLEISAQAVIYSKDSDLRMGFEIETSAIKVRAEDNERIGFTFSRKGTPIWRIEDDTLDHAFEKDVFFEHNKNLECKTFTGLDDKEALIDVSKSMDKLLKQLLFFSK